MKVLNDIVEPMEDHLGMSRFNNYAKDGKFYGIDHHIGACIVWYNTEILEEAGIDYHDIKTWDDYHEAGKVVLEKTGKPMCTWESKDCWSIYPLVNQHGGRQAHVHLGVQGLLEHLSAGESARRRLAHPGQRGPYG